MYEELLHDALDEIWNQSSERNWIIGRLGVRNGTDYDIDVPGRPGWVFVSLGINGELGRNEAKDRVGVAPVGFTVVRMRRENGVLVIRDADELAAVGGITTMLGLSDVQDTGWMDGYVPAYDTATGKFIPSAGGSGGGGGGAPSPHARNSTHHTGLEAWVNIDKSGSSLAHLDTRLHSDLAGVTADQHHTMVHPLVGPDADGITHHTAAGLTQNHVLKATSASSFSFQSPIHGILDSFYHSVVGNNFDVVGLTGQNTLGLLVPSSNPGSSAALLRTETNGNINLGGSMFAVQPLVDTITSTAKWTFNDDATFNTGVFQFNTNPQVNADLDFVGATDRFITADLDLYIAPEDSLYLSPWDDVHLTPLGAAYITPTTFIQIAAGDTNVYFGDNQNIRSVTQEDNPFGIKGFRLWERSDVVDYWQLTMGAAKFDELYARAFVADETRVSRGEQIWSKSFGVVAETFTLPSLGGTVNVWFENSPALASGDLFEVGDWLLMRVIQVASGHISMMCWFEVQSRVVDGTTGGDRQRWALIRRKLGVAGEKVLKGNNIVDVGKVGQGWIYLTALKNTEGPYIDVGRFSTITDSQPIHTAHVRMGRVDNVAGLGLYSGNPRWGIAAGNNLAVAPQNGFSGFHLDNWEGLRLFNTDIRLYNGVNEVVRLHRDEGLTFASDAAWYSDHGRWITWQRDMALTETIAAYMGVVTSVGIANTFDISFRRTASNGISAPTLRLEVDDDVAGLAKRLELDANVLRLMPNDRGNLSANPIFMVGFDRFVFNRDSTGSGLAQPNTVFMELRDKTSATDLRAGIYLYQVGTGDAVIHFRNQSGNTYWSIGSDQSNNNNFVISPSTSLNSSVSLIMTESGLMGYNVNTPMAQIHISGIHSGSAERGSNVGAAIRINNIYTGSNLHGPELQFSAGDRGVGAAVGALRGSGGSEAIVYGMHLVFSTSPVRTSLLYPIERMRITEHGLIGIGTQTPSYQVDIVGRSRVRGTTGGGGGGWFLNDSGTDETSFMGRGAGYTGIWSKLAGWQIVAIDAGTIGIGTETPTNIEPNSVVTVQYNRANIMYMSLINSGAGQVGINYQRTGTNASKWITYIPQGANSWRIFSQTAQLDVFTANSNGKIGINENNPAGQLDIMSRITSGLYVTHQSNTAWLHMVLRRSRIDGSGNLVQLLDEDVIGSIGAVPFGSGGWTNAATGQIQFKADEAYSSTGRGTKILFLVTKNGTQSQLPALILGNDRDFTAPGIYNFTTLDLPNVNIDSNGWMRRYVSSSSIRYKKDVETLSLPDDFFDKVRPVTFRYNENMPVDDQSLQVGLIAEEVSQAGGDIFIKRDKQGRIDNVHYPFFNMALLLEIQNLRRRVAALENARRRLR